ncbi:U3-containing 90S pre-ribosomal complex subunit-domain containing protein [Hypoxylon trugodes]|uniref:U3-containing 90S pre-ribosomal complex subunit-domain containing protein n=1 Tax=Hypoxylon trugodes TaxID=326681 RepID=UPI00219B5A09|nr:U3-containing 90S pre-ribosomal complex subunit-domain containing protein [Hypoxylon trugodes]KAI1392551.1 U3-containing 90S pre-ribosomal complex subunit-domain containing protein [Hypoxylon trugodes]
MSETQVIRHKPAAPKAKPKKRRQDDESRSRKRRKPTTYEEDEEFLDLDAGVNKKVAQIDNLLLADYLANKIRRFGTDLKPVELSQLDISPSYIKDTTSFDKTRSLDNLPDFLEQFADPKKLSEAPKQNGSPHTIIVTGAGLRAAEITRAVRKYQTKHSTVAKLFAKHIKIEESVQFLEKHRTGIAVGTPVRLSDLVEKSSLKLDKLERLVVDASHIDQKKRGVMDMKETMLPLARWLARTEFKERYADPEKGLQLLFY